MLTTVCSRKSLRWWCGVALLGIVGAGGGCKQKLDKKFVERLCIEASQCDEPEAIGRDVRVLCDRTEFSPCTKLTLAATLKVLLPTVAKVPGSHLSLWMLTNSVGTTGNIAEVTSPKPKSHRAGEQHAEQDRWVSTAEVTMLKAAEPYWKAPQPKKTLLAAAFTKIGMVESPLPRTTVAISDGFEVEGRGLDLECGVLPSAERFLKMLHERGWLGANSLTGSEILFTFMQVGPQPRCGADIARLLKVRQLWERALQVAGAKVAFSTGVVQLGAVTVAEAGREGGMP